MATATITSSSSSMRDSTKKKAASRPAEGEEKVEGVRIRYRAGGLRRRRRRRQSCEGEEGGGDDDERIPYPSECSTLSYVIARQIDDKVDYCKSLVNARFGNSENLYRKDLLSHYGCVNAIEFSNQGDLLVSGGDDRRVLLWKVEQAIQGIGKPSVMKAQHVSNIFCLGYDSSKTKIFSAGNDDQVIVHDLRTSDVLNFFLHEKPVYGLSIHPHNDNVFASACDDGRVLIYDIRGSSTTETFCLAQYKTAFHSVMFNPVDPRMLATANAKEGVSMWDVRKPLEPVLRYGSESPAQSCMNVRFNALGNRLLALRRRLPPVLYAVDSSTYLCEFDHPGYYNSCTMKSCCFAGDNDEYILSGSDDFNLYMWKIPPMEVSWVESAHMVLRGHRSIVNQVRYNQASCIFASSGVEKIIKIWSPFSLGAGCLGGLKRDAGKREKQRRVFTHDEYIGLVLRSGQFMTHDYSHQSTREDPRMMAFFDSLVQREIEGWSSEDVPTAPQTPSGDSEINPVTGEPYSESDFDADSTASEGGVAPERSLESPNRITRLIATRREKLMRLAAMDCGTTCNTSSNVAERSASGSGSEGNNARAKHRSKSKLNSKGIKRKHARTSGRRSRARRKCTVLKIGSDSDSDDGQLIDTAQPSTSSGVISRRSRYADIDIKYTNYNSSSNSSSNSNNSTSISTSNNNSNSGMISRRCRYINMEKDIKHTSYSSSSSRNNGSSSSSSSNSNSSSTTTTTTTTSSSSSSGNSSSSNSSSSNSSSSSSFEDNDIPLKRRHSKTDLDASTKAHRKKHRSKCKNSSRHENSDKNPGKRQKFDHDIKEERTGWKNGTSTSKVREDGPSTPINKSFQVPSSPGSGIKLGIYAGEKSSGQIRKRQNDTDNINHEQKPRNLECFRKNVDVTKRSYRNRSPAPLPQTVSVTTETTTDSSD